MKLIADSSANLRKVKDVNFAFVPLKVIISDKEYSDMADLDVEGMILDMEASKEKSGTACPSIGEWLDAFGDEEEILAFALTGTLSGCYSSAVTAAEQYMEEHPDRKVKVIDTLSTGPEVELAVEKCARAISEGMSYEDVCRLAESYIKDTGLLFSLATLENFAKNGRVSPALAKLVGVLNIHIVGRASEAGELEPLHKCRGEKKAIDKLWTEMCDEGYVGGKVRIRHTQNRRGAVSLLRRITDSYPDADVKAGSNKGICSYYAERGGLLVGFEKKPSDDTEAQAEVAGSAEASENAGRDIRRIWRRGLHGRKGSEE